jgi:hypothetical protein
MWSRHLWKTDYADGAGHRRLVTVYRSWTLVRANLINAVRSGLFGRWSLTAEVAPREGPTPFPCLGVQELQERLAGVIIEQPCIPDVAGENLHGPVPADLLDLPDVGAGARGRGHEAGPKRVPAIALGIQPGGLHPGLQDARDRMVGQPAPRTRWPPFHNGRNSGPSVIEAAASQARRWTRGRT